MKVVAGIAVAAALVCAAPAHAAEVMVVGRDDKVLKAPKQVSLKARKLKVGARTCTVGARTPLSLLVATGLPVRARDQGVCGRSARDAGTIYVFSVAGQRERGRGGWVYKVGRRAGTAGAADPSGSFGNGRLLRSSDRVLWFWCELGATGCQRTRVARRAARTVAPGAPLRVTVSGYDDRGRGIRIAGATVGLRGATAVTDAAGVATLTAPATAGAGSLTAQHPGSVRAAPVKVTVR